MLPSRGVCRITPPWERPPPVDLIVILLGRSSLPFADEETGSMARTRRNWDLRPWPCAWLFLCCSCGPQLLGSCDSACREKQGWWGCFAKKLLLLGKALLSCQVRDNPSITSLRLLGNFPSEILAAKLRMLWWPRSGGPQAWLWNEGDPKLCSLVFPLPGFCTNLRKAGWPYGHVLLLKRRILCFWSFIYPPALCCADRVEKTPERMFAWGWSLTAVWAVLVQGRTGSAPAEGALRPSWAAATRAPWGSGAMPPPAFCHCGMPTEGLASSLTPGRLR